RTAALKPSTWNCLLFGWLRLLFVVAPPPDGAAMKSLRHKQCLFLATHSNKALTFLTVRGNQRWISFHRKMAETHRYSFRRELNLRPLIELMRLMREEAEFLLLGFANGEEISFLTSRRAFEREP